MASFPASLMAARVRTDSFPADLPYAVRGLPIELHEVLRRQRRLVTTRQLREAGVTREKVRWGLSRQWTAPLPGVIQIGDGALDAGGRAMAAVLFAGEHSALTGASAAAFYGIRAAESADRAVHVVVPGQSRGRVTRWVHVHRSVVRDSGIQRRQGMRTASVARAVVDAARWSSADEQAEAIVIEACQRRMTTAQALHDQLAQFGHAPGSARARRAIAAAESGAWSIPELRLAQAVSSSRVLPEPWLNPTLTAATGQRLVSPDMWFDDVALAVMVHSKAHHQIGQDWVATVEADGVLTAHGVHVLGLTPTTILRDPATALRRIEEAYLAARSAPRPTKVTARRRH